MFSTQREYWIGSGWSRPSSARSAATAPGSASCPSMIWTGSPGVRCSIRNTPMLRMTRTGTVPSSRPPRKRRNTSQARPVLRSRLPGGFETHQAIRSHIKALHGLRGGKVRGREIGENVGCVIVDRLLQLEQDLFARRLIACQPLADDRVVHCLARIFAVVEGALRFEDGLDVAVGVNAAAPAERQGIEI